MKSVMKHDFGTAPTINAPRSSFDRSCGYKSSFDAGYLIPFFIDDVLPGDTFNLQATAIARLSTPYKPIMDNMYIDTHFFFVPWRIIWDNSKKFFGEQENPSDSIDYALPVFTEFTPAEKSLHDYMELPPGFPMSPVSLYHRAYNLIWNEWFRDQNLQDSVTVDKGDGPDNSANYTLLKRGKRHDYFTSCLPSPQKGAAVTLPLGLSAPVVPIVNTDASGSMTGLAGPTFLKGAGGTSHHLMQFATDSTAYYNSTSATGPLPMIWENPALQTDLTSATAATINDLRESFQVQKLLEKDARSGTRYSELVNSHFGVNFYDHAYRPEFLGGGSSPINATPVPDTAFSPGLLGAYATAGFSGHGFTKSFVEHGIVMGLVSVRADLTYQQGIPRRYLKSTRYDIYWPSLAHLGEQAVTNAEIYYDNTAADDDVFGYQERHAEYRYKPSSITSTMRSTATTPLDIWHLSQEFLTRPSLGATFIQEDPPIDRIIRTPSEDHFIFDSYISLRCARPMPIRGIPGMIDHF